MPNRDGTGPQGKGPKTGRGQGRCGQSFNNQSDVQSQKDCGRGQGKQPCGNMTTKVDNK
jgi:hypothetical protein